jgi:hypothetical protein
MELVIEMRKFLFILVFGLILSLVACSEEDGEILFSPPSPSIEELEARVIENAYIVRDALEEYRAHNRGACPIDINTDTNDLGLTLIDLLPGGELLENPFTGERTEPVDTIASEPGQIGFHLRSRYMPHFYYISGVGESFTIVELSNLEELEWVVIQNCLVVRETVEKWAALNGGIYPCCVGVDTTPEGYTVTSLLPDGHLLENPFHGCATEPIDGTAAISGQTGYVPVVQGGFNTGYTITGTGLIAGTNSFTWSQSATDTCININGVTVFCTYEY